MDVPVSENNSARISFERERGVYGVTVIRNVAHLVILTGDEAGRTDRILEVLRVLAGINVPVFLIKMHRTRVAMAMAGTDLERASRALEATGMQVATRRDLALVAIRAASMRDQHGVIIMIADALFEAGVQILEIGDSHDSVQCLLEAGKIADAVASLRSKFHLDAGAVHDSSVEAEDGA
jgi:aspartokinase